MKKQCKVAMVLVVAVVFCFASASMVEAKGPIWQIFRAGTNQSINWKTHAANPRFAKWKAGTNGDTSDDIVLDRETGLVWERQPVTSSGSWSWACDACLTLNLGKRRGWRLPTYEELSSLLDMTQSNPSLPSGNPFLPSLTAAYWTSTTYQFTTTSARWIQPGPGAQGAGDKTTGSYRRWCVRGGFGHDGY